MDLFNRGLLENELMTNAWDNQAFLDSSPEGSVGAPSGVQPTPPNPQANKDPVRSLLGLGSFLPGIGGDLLGPIADLRAMQQDPDKRTLANLALFGVGALPVIPSMVWMMNRASDLPIRRGVFGNQSGALGYHGTTNPNFANEEFHPLSHFGSRPQAANDILGIANDHLNSTDQFLNSSLVNKLISVPRHIRKVDLDIQNPLRIDDFGGQHEPFDYVRAAADKNALTTKEYNALVNINKISPKLVGPALIKNLRAKGYDGFVYENRAEDIGQDSYVIFSPEQVHPGLGKRTSAFGDIPVERSTKTGAKAKYVVYGLDNIDENKYFSSKKEVLNYLSKMQKDNPNLNYEWDQIGE